MPAMFTITTLGDVHLVSGQGFELSLNGPIEDAQAFVAWLNSRVPSQEVRVVPEPLPGQRPSTWPHWA
jgi:hypothetical protein